MDWLAAMDLAVFRFINISLSNPLFDAVMPLFAWNAAFVPLVLLGGILLAWKGGIQGRLCLAFLLLALVIGDNVICAQLKEAFARPRPFHDVPDINLLVGRGSHSSMPSSHAANWFAAMVVSFAFYRRSLRLLLPLALVVAFSRVYTGAHYPSDVFVGALLGMAYAAALVFGANALWEKWAPRWFPSWFARRPSLLRAPVKSAPVPNERPISTELPGGDVQWLRLGYLFIGIVLLARLAYLAGGKIELSEDEAYQWLWSKHLALSYYSKPPFIAYAQFIGTSIWGDTEFGIRFLSPLITAGASLLLLRFFAREVNARAAFFLVLAATATPLLAVGATLMTIDPLNVLFWTAAMLSGWRAIQENSTRHWLWTGLWMGCGFLSKYTALFQWLCWAVFFVLWKPARRQLRRPGPYLALLVNALCTLPVLIWNQQNGWITVTHLAERGGLERQWVPTLRFFWDFLSAEALLLNPVFFVALVWAAFAFWRRHRNEPFFLYLFSMGAPLFLFYLFYTLRARVQPNWIAPAVLPLLALAVVYWDARWRAGVRPVKHWLIAGLTFGLVGIILLHDTNLIRKITGHPLPAAQDPLRRVRAWSDVARVVGEERERLAAEGTPAFIIGGHYGITGLISFYLPAAKAGVPDHPLVYYRSTERPVNQFYFWPGYQERKGQNAIYAVRADRPKSPPETLLAEFHSVTDLGFRDITYRGRVFHRIQLFECRDLR